MTVVDSLSRAVRGPLLVIGRPPPEGRDLDLLARPEDAAALATHLADEGFVEHGGRWVRFAGCDAEVVDVVDVATWGLPTAEVDDLFAAAEPLDGVLTRPAPVHVLLIEARRVLAGSTFTARRQARVEAALHAWDDAVRRAPAWGVAEILPALRAAPRRRARRLPRRGALVALSGVDGSGKSSQAEALAATLERLGYGTATVWTRITINPSLDVLARPVKALLGARRPSGRSTDTSDTGGPASRPPGWGARADDPARAFRLRHPLVNGAWLTVVAVVNALAVNRAVAAHLARGRVVVCDRSTLDSAAHLRYKYGPAERHRFQVAVIRLLTPRPLRAYLLDVPGPVAHARKPEKYTPEGLDVLGGLYREEGENLGVQRLDGTLPREALCARIADDVLSALVARGAPRRRRGRAAGGAGR